MEVTRLSLVSHQDDKGRPQAIFSLSLSPYAPKLLTSALDSTVAVWTPLGRPLSPSSTLSRHEGAVLSARWSPSHVGCFASAADDKRVIVWSEVAGMAEVYRVVCVLPSVHTSDITALEWSADGHWLATGSLDKSIVLYSVPATLTDPTFRIVQKVELGGFVKGLSFSPDSRLLAVQCDDRTARLFRVSNASSEDGITKALQEIRRIAACFVNSPDSTFFTRPSFSPDGRLLAVANACNGPISSICLIPIDGLPESVDGKPTTDDEEADFISLIGHQAPVEVVRFSPFTYTFEGESDGSKSIMAAGCQDGSVSVWSSDSASPLLVLTDLFTAGVMDIQWSSDGFGFHVCSYDGSVCNVKMDEMLIGKRAITKLPIMSSQKASSQKLSELHLPDIPPKAPLVPVVGGRKRITPTLINISSATSAGSVVRPLDSTQQQQQQQQLQVFVKLECPLLSERFPRLSLPLQKSWLFSFSGLSEPGGLLHIPDALGNHPLQIEVVGGRVMCVKSNRVMWKETLSGRTIQHASAAGRIIALLLSDGHVVVMSVTGRRVLPEIVLPSPITCLDCCLEDDLLIITAGGVLYWMRDLCTEKPSCTSTLIPDDCKDLKCLVEEDLGISVGGLRFDGSMWTIKRDNGVFEPFRMQSRGLISVEDVEKALLGPPSSAHSLDTLIRMEEILAAKRLSNEDGDLEKFQRIYKSRLDAEGLHYRAAI